MTNLPFKMIFAKGLRKIKSEIFNGSSTNEYALQSNRTDGSVQDQNGQDQNGKPTPQSAEDVRRNWLQSEQHLEKAKHEPSVAPETEKLMIQRSQAVYHSLCDSSIEYFENLIDETKEMKGVYAPGDSRLEALDNEIASYYKKIAMLIQEKADDYTKVEVPRGQFAKVFWAIKLGFDEHRSKIFYIKSNK